MTLTFHLAWHLLRHVLLALATLLAAFSALTQVDQGGIALLPGLMLLLHHLAAPAAALAGASAAAAVARSGAWVGLRTLGVGPWDLFPASLPSACLLLLCVALLDHEVRPGLDQPNRTREHPQSPWAWAWPGGLLRAEAVVVGTEGEPELHGVVVRWHEIEPDGVLLFESPMLRWNGLTWVANGGRAVALQDQELVDIPVRSLQLPLDPEHAGRPPLLLEQRPSHTLLSLHKDNGVGRELVRRSLSGLLAAAALWTGALVGLNQRGHEGLPARALLLSAVVAATQVLLSAACG